MKKKTATPETKDETQAFFNTDYKQDIQDIKLLLKAIAESLDDISHKVDYRGGFN